MDSLKKRDDQENAAENAEFSQTLDRMWQKFLPDIRQRAGVLAEAGRAAEAGTLGQAGREAAKSAAHKLAGTLGMFGLGRGTALARELEQMYAANPGPAKRLSAMAAEIQSMIENRQ